MVMMAEQLYVVGESYHEYPEMPVKRGTLRDDDGETVDGGVFHGQSNDTPDDVIVVDLRDDEESLNWTKYGPEDSRERFSEWSDEKAKNRSQEAQERLREYRQSRGE
ncbi:hypothetical protein [Halarchaeum nitratireducens]|uniref:Uncharacterized protein n=1 Tax=Halarchaeum nitratireducens TaxID=489913 RepID=A0A830GBV9_9EURY|nr:hypothetical protein [Halarchaeum nitratireducens]GGN17857.1 hypothetical protein GCM10009021_18420 [Halarchaeum nitratireducens]